VLSVGRGATDRLGEGFLRLRKARLGPCMVARVSREEAQALVGPPLMLGRVGVPWVPPDGAVRERGRGLDRLDRLRHDPGREPSYLVGSPDDLPTGVRSVAFERPYVCECLLGLCLLYRH